MWIQEQFNKLTLNTCKEQIQLFIGYFEKSKETILEFYKGTVKVY